MLNIDDFEQYIEKLLKTFIEITIEEQSDFLKIKETLTRIGVEQSDFQKIKETLTRIGMSTSNKKVLWQSCHILHKKGKLYIVHFKELFALDGKQTNFDQIDLGRRNTIAMLLEDWNLLKIINPEQCKEPLAPLFQIKIIAHKDKPNWQLIPKYSIGNKKGRIDVSSQ